MFSLKWLVLVVYQLLRKTMRNYREKQPFKHDGRIVRPPAKKPFKKANIADNVWRLENLYYIIDKDGKVVKFKMFPIQRKFLENMWYRNAVLKSRQHGFTTLIDLWIIDQVLFVPNTTAVIIAHRTDDAAAILKSKAEFPYENLHPSIKKRIPLVEKNKTTMTFANGSSIKVTTSGRSGTAQILHVSELGYTSRHRPDVASEIVNGSFPAIHENGFIFVESTAEGTSGEFADICRTSENKKKERRKLTRLDFKFHFYGWHEKPTNTLPPEEAAYVVIPDRLQKYFMELERDEGIILDDGQKAWYSTQEDIFQDKMKQEHPSTAAEAFANSGKGHYFKTQMSDLRESGRLCEVPHTRGRMVHTFWDIGVNDETAVIFAQQIGDAWKIIDYYEETDQGLDWHIEHTREIAKEKGYLLGDWVGPHDLKRRQGSDAKQLWETAAKLGVKFIVVPKVSFKSVSIDITRTMFSLLYIHEDLETLIEHLDNYKKEWDKIRGTWKDKPFHDRASNAADALQQWAMFLDKSIDDSEKNSRARQDPRKASNMQRVVAGQDIGSNTNGFTNSRNRSMSGYL